MLTKKFNLEDYSKTANYKNYTGKRVLIDSISFMKGKYGDINSDIAKSTEIYIAVARSYNILYLYKSSENSIEGHQQAWNRDEENVWHKINNFKYGPYKSWNASAKYITDIFEDEQLEFDF
jgi:hypothetical protein